MKWDVGGSQSVAKKDVDVDVDADADADAPAADGPLNVAAALRLRFC